MALFDFLNPKKQSANNDLQAVLTPAKSENFLSQFLPDNILPDDPDKRSAVAQALIMGGANAMAAGGPSVGKPTNLLSVLGQGLAGGVKGYDDAITTDNDSYKTRIAGNVANQKLKTQADTQARTKAFFEKYGQPGAGGYGPEALADMLQIQILNGDNEGAKATQAQLQKLSQEAAQKGQVFDPSSGKFVVAPGYNEGIQSTKQAEATGNAAGKNLETTADVKNYEYGKDNPGFVQQQIDLKKAGVATPDNEFDKKGAQLAAERYNTYAQQGVEAQQMVGNVNNLSELAKQIGTGRWAQVRKAWGPWAASFGVKVDGLDEAQAFDSMKARIAPTMRQPGSGASSDTDVNMFLDSLPSLGNTPEGNAIISDTIKSVQDVKIQAAQIANRVNSGEITWQEGDKLIAGLPDPYANYKAYRKGDKGRSTATSPSGEKTGSTAAPKTSRVPVVSSEDAFTQLPKGATFRFDDDPEGTVRTKN